MQHSSSLYLLTGGEGWTAHPEFGCLPCLPPWVPNPLRRGLSRPLLSCWMPRALSYLAGKLGWERHWVYFSVFVLDADCCTNLFQNSYSDCLASSPNVQNSGGIPVHPKGVGWGWGQSSVHSSISTLNWENRLFMELALCMRTLACWNKKWANTKLEAQY